MDDAEESDDAAESKVMFDPNARLATPLLILALIGVAFVIWWMAGG